MTPFATTTWQGDTPALLLHCSLASHQAILPLAKKLPNLRATCMDLLGHGASPTPDGPNDLHANAKAAASIWTGPGCVIGHSYGAAVAVRFALDHPDRVTRLILIEPVLFAAAKRSTGHTQFRTDFGPIADAFAADDMTRAAQLFMGLWGDGTPWAQVPKPLQIYAAQRMGFVRDSEADLENDASGIFEGTALADLQMPVTLIRGAESHPVIANIHDALESRFAQATQHVIAGAGHMSPITHVDAVADIIKTDAR